MRQTMTTTESPGVFQHVFNDRERGIVDHAAAARAEGATLFTPEMTGRPDEIYRWGPLLAAIEETGWQLEQWSVTAADPLMPVAFPVFRASAEVRRHGPAHPGGPGDTTGSAED